MFNIGIQFSFTHESKGQSQGRPNIVRHDLALVRGHGGRFEAAVFEAAPGRLKVEAGEEVLDGLRIGLVIHKENTNMKCCLILPYLFTLDVSVKICFSTKSLC